MKLSQLFRTSELEGFSFSEISRMIDVRKQVLDEIDENCIISVFQLDQLHDELHRRCRNIEGIPPMEIPF